MGDPTNIIYRSSWELKLMSYLDKHPNVTRWGSEEMYLPYKSPVDGKLHRYFPDFYVEQINTEKKKEKILIEVKPKYQTMPPDVSKKKTPTGKISKTFLQEVKNYGVNQAKWKAAKQYCADRGWRFQIMTEEHLGIK
tara:strand:+ start:501 stop:911 length:411 start_codon:yes stop_codon:yes gene_type:complete